MLSQKTSIFLTLPHSNGHSVPPLIDPFFYHLDHNKLSKHLSSTKSNENRRTMSLSLSLSLSEMHIFALTLKKKTKFFWLAT